MNDPDSFDFSRLETKPMHRYTIRASSLSELFDCPARWEAKHLLGIRAPSSTAAHLGTAIHAGAARFDQERIDSGSGRVEDALAATVDTLLDPSAEVNWRDGEWSKADAERQAKLVVARYAIEESPKHTWLKVESQCEPLSIQFGDVDITLTGTTDRVAMDPCLGTGIRDLKSTRRDMNSRMHRAQLGVYRLLEQESSGQPLSGPDGIVELNTRTGRVEAHVLEGSTTELLFGPPGEPGLLEHAAALLKAGAFYGNPKSNLCSEKYCPRWQTCRWR